MGNKQNIGSNFNHIIYLFFDFVDLTNRGARFLCRTFSQSGNY